MKIAPKLPVIKPGDKVVDIRNGHEYDVIGEMMVYYVRSPKKIFTDPIPAEFLRKVERA